MALNIEALQTSFDLVAPQAELLSQKFYEQLFEDYPELEPLFANTELKDQQQKLILALKQVIKLLEKPEQLTELLHNLGKRHVDYGATPADYAPVKKTMLATLAEVAGGYWSEDLEQAWDEALDAVATLMIEGAQQAEEKQFVTSSTALQKNSEETSTPKFESKISFTTSKSHTRPNSFQKDIHPREDPKMNLAQETQTTQTVEQFYGMVENSPLIKFFVDQQGKVNYLNKRGHELFRQLGSTLGFTPEEFVGGSIERLYELIPELRSVAYSTSTKSSLRATLGTEWIDINLSAVTGSDGTQLGLAHEWNIVTQTVTLEADSAKVRSMVEQMPINVIMANTDFEITYLNPASKNQLKQLESFLPINIDEIVGQKIDIFHKNPAHQRGIVGNPRNLPHRAEIQVGPEILDLLVSAVKDNQGNYIGPMVTWEVVTEKLKAEAEMIRVQNMMENIPINVMLANRDFELVYLNPMSKKTLKQLQHLLPKPVDQLIGEKIDIFHKKPEYQRQILADPKNLPRQANIKVGSETLDLLVSAIYDKDGEFIGPMVTWSVVSEQIQLATNVQGVMDVVSSSSSEMRVHSKSMATFAEETSRQAQSMAAASEETTSNVQTVSSAAEELNASIAEIARHVQDASSMTSQAVDEAVRTNVTIEDLGKASEEIGQVIKVINSIAQQTNLLALNATIEAARAGEAGKGFAVVANEVKELARQTGKATEEISQKIGAIQNSTNLAVCAIESIGEQIKKINEISTTVASAVEEQSAATNEISRNISEAAKGTEEVNRNINGVSQAAEDQGKQAAEMLSSAENLAQESSRLEEVTKQFLEKLGAK